MKEFSSSIVQWDSIEIPLKWGSLRGKRLRNTSRNIYNKMPVKVLGIHGWLDNCNSFDHVVSFFPSYIEFVALDLPGNGYSDHLPYGSRYDPITYAYSIKDAADFLQWESFIYLGHSMGSAIGHILAGIFPELIKSLICIDHICYRGVISNPLAGPSVWKESLEFYQIQNFSPSPPLYTKEEALKRFINSRISLKTNLPFIDKSAADVLIERAIKPVHNKEGLFTWCHDQRAKKRFQVIFTQEMFHDLVSTFEFPILLITADEGMYKGCTETEFNESKLISAYSTKCKNFHYVKVPGNHYPHFEYAFKVSNVIIEFIEKIIFTSML